MKIDKIATKLDLFGAFIELRGLANSFSDTRENEFSLVPAKLREFLIAVNAGSVRRRNDTFTFTLDDNNPRLELTDDQGELAVIRFKKLVVLNTFTLDLDETFHVRGVELDIREKITLVTFIDLTAESSITKVKLQTTNGITVNFAFELVS